MWSSDRLAGRWWCSIAAPELEFSAAGLPSRRRPGGDLVSGSILLGHTHWDHIQGLPFFEPLFGNGRWDVYGPRGLGGSLDQTLAGQMNYQYFPVALHELGPGVAYHELVEGTFEIGDLLVRTQYLNHPALTLGYRVEGDGAVVCYVADHEPFDSALGSGGDVLASRDDARHVEFLAGADVVIHDAQYDASEYAARVGWGHSTVEYVVDVACAAGVHRTVLFHHDPVHDDNRIDALVELANTRAAGRTQVAAAAEGDVVEASSASPRRAPHTTPAAWASPALEDLNVSIVIISGDQALRAAVEEAAGAEQLRLVDRDAAASGDEGGRVVVVADIDDDAHALDHLRSAMAPSAWTRVGNRRGHPRPERDRSRACRCDGLARLAFDRRACSHEAPRCGAPAGESVDGRPDASR